MNPPAHPAPSSAAWLAWAFVLVWGSGYIASKAGLQHAAPFTFLTLRFSLGLLLLVPLLLWAARREPLRWPGDARGWLHVVVAGLLMHAANLGGSHYAQYFGMSAGVTALVLATQPLATAFIAAALLHERLRPYQWQSWRLPIKQLREDYQSLRAFAAAGAGSEDAQLESSVGGV